MLHTQGQLDRRNSDPRRERERERERERDTQAQRELRARDELTNKPTVSVFRTAREEEEAHSREVRDDGRQNQDYDGGPGINLKFKSSLDFLPFSSRARLSIRGSEESVRRAVNHG